MVSSRLLITMTSICLTGCASYSSKAIGSLDNQHPAFQTFDCQNARENAWIHEDLKQIKLVAGPSLLLFAGPILAIPVLLANVGLNTADHLKANDIKSLCGGKALTPDELTQSIVIDTGVAAATGSLLPSATVLASKP
jgi:hypothetical protein